MMNLILYLLRSAFSDFVSVDPDFDLKSVPVEEWRRAVECSGDQGVASLIVDGYQKWADAHPDVKTGLDSPEMEEEKYNLLGNVFITEEDYDFYVSKMMKLCSVFSKKGLKPLILKGYGLNLEYPVPSHRPTGDIDLFLFDEALRHDDDVALAGDRIMVKAFGKVVTRSRHGRHSHANYKGIAIENHYELCGTFLAPGRIVRYEKLLQAQAALGCRQMDGYFLPSATFNALFLMWHMAGHLVYENVNLKQLCDWLMFLTHHHHEVDWPLVRKAWAEVKLTRIADAVNLAMVEYFGMGPSVIPWQAGPSAGKDAARLMTEVLGGGRRSWRWLDNLLYYPRNAWKFSLATGRPWVCYFLRNVWIHIAHKAEMQEREISL